MAKKKPAKEVYLGKIAIGKIIACSFNKKTPSQVSFTVKLTQKIFKFFRIPQRAEVVIVNVKHKFHLESRSRDEFTKNTRQCSTLSNF